MNVVFPILAALILIGLVAALNVFSSWKAIERDCRKRCPRAFERELSYAYWLDSFNELGGITPVEMPNPEWLEVKHMLGSTPFAAWKEHKKMLHMNEMRDFQP